MVLNIDEVLDTLLQNMTLGHTEYFKLKKCEKQPMQKGLSDFPRTQAIKPSWDGRFLHIWKEVPSLSLGHQEESG